MGDGFLPYWVRFWNVFPATAIVWLAYAAARLIMPGRPALRLGVALLAAVMPQDAFYAVQNDVLSPVCFGLAFLGLTRFLRAAVPGRGLAVGTGLALAATCLVKTSNLPLLAVGFAAVIFKAWQLGRTETPTTSRAPGVLPPSPSRRAGGKGRGEVAPSLDPPSPSNRDLAQAAPALTWLLVCAVAPVAAMFVWNLHTFGDLTGSAVKIAALGWTHKPFAQWWGHPIFTPRGFYAFWSELMASFWRGELIWGWKLLAWPAMDALYWISSTVFVALGVASLLPRSGAIAGWPRQALWLGFWSFAASVAFLGLLSIMFDFGKCVNPSPAHPYFSSGRLITGALIPFLLLYVRGLDWALGSRENGRLTLGALTTLAIVITISEVFINLPPFSSRYNLFHWLAATH
jgi:hypothetical protein